MCSPQCLACGSQFRAIGKDALRKHGIDPDKLPWWDMSKEPTRIGGRMEEERERLYQEELDWE